MPKAFGGSDAAMDREGKAPKNDTMAKRKDKAGVLIRSADGLMEKSLKSGRKAVRR